MLRFAPRTKSVYSIHRLCPLHYAIRKATNISESKGELASLLTLINVIYLVIKPEFPEPYPVAGTPGMPSGRQDKLVAARQGKDYRPYMPFFYVTA